MSGPKGGAYQVISEAELRRRAVAAARQSVADALRRVAVATDGLDELVHAQMGREAGIAMPRRPADDDLEGLQRYVLALGDVVDRAAEVRAAVSAHRARRLLARAGTRSDRRSISAAEVLTGPGSEKPDVRDDVAERVDRLLTRMPVDAPAPERDRVDQLAATALASADRTAEYALRHTVQRAIERSRLRAAASARAQQLRMELAAYADDPDAAQALSDLADVIAGDRDLTDELVAAAAAATDGARRRRDQAVAASAVAAALAELGYETEPEFARLVVHDGVAHARHAAVPDYAVRWRLRGDRLVFHLVRRETAGRSARAQQIRDREAERAWCAEVDAVLARIARHGVTVELDRRTPAGEHAVLAVEDLPFQQATRARQRRDAAHERTREH